MTLSPGSRLGVYEVSAKIGEGGMGEVYRARDTALDRDVALKVLPEAFTQDPERLARFEREAKLLASLNHTNIASIYGLEEAHGTKALVLELVNGPTLADRIEQGPLPLDEALPIARQITEALEAAHEAGVIHRDLKPANVKVRDDGTVKVLDFGLAKALDTTPEGNPDQSPTLTAAATQMGMILGTAAYMSPEQARGKPVDRRADIWAFGCVLYEMLTGQRPYHGEDISLTLSKVLQSEPDWHALPDAVPPGLRLYLQRCLRKDPRERIRDIGDIRLALDGVVNGQADGAFEMPRPEGEVSVPPGRTAGGWRQTVPWGLAAVLALTVAGLSWSQLGRAPATPAATTRFAISAPPGAQLTAQRPVVSPDGSSVLLITTEGVTTQLYLRRLDEAEAVRLPGTDGAGHPAFSADGQWIYFSDFNTDTLNRISVEGGAPQRLTDAGFGGSTSGPDDTVLYTRSYSEGLWQISADGGSPTQLTTPDPSRAELGHWWPQLLPDQETVLFTSFSTPIERSRLMTYSLRTGQQTEILAEGYYGRYTPTGHLLFGRGASVLAVPFDTGRLQTSGPAVPVLDDVNLTFFDGQAGFTVSDNGTLVFARASEVNGHNRLAWRDRAGATTRTDSAIAGLLAARLSPDGRRVALVIEDEGLDIWVQDLEQGGRTKVTFGAASEFAPIWRPDGNGLVYLVEEPQFHLYTQLLNDTGGERLLHGGPYDSIPTSITPDGWVLFAHHTQDTGVDIWMVPLDGSQPARAVLETRFAERAATLSPDGRWLAYQSNESGRDEVYVRSFPELAGPYPVSRDGGTSPLWSRNGQELFYRRGDALITVPVSMEEEFSVGPLTQQTVRRDVSGGVGDSIVETLNLFDETPDGEFFVVERGPAAPPLRAHVVLNWFNELEALVPIP